MPKCPKCKAQIDYLNYYEKALQTASFFLSNSKTAEYGNWKTLSVDSDTQDFDCPECQETLFNNEEEALNFLKNP